MSRFMMGRATSCQLDSLQELGFLHYLRRAGVPVSEYSFPPNKIVNLAALRCTQVGLTIVSSLQEESI